MDLFPIFLKLEGRRILIVGGGNVALEKITSLSTAGALLRIVAPQAIAAVRQLGAEGKLVWEQRPFSESDVLNADLVIAATNDPSVNAAAFRAARSHGILCNSADDPPNCDFYFPSIVRRGKLQIAISTAGESPALAQQIRREIDAGLPADIARSLSALGQLRRKVLSTHPAGEERKKLLHNLASRQVCDAPTCPARELAFPTAPAQADGRQEAPDTATEQILPLPPVIGRGSANAEKGVIYLVGAGPGNPELLTLRAARLLASADTILYDDLVTPAILNLARSTALLINVGKRCGVKTITQPEINAMMIDLARKGLSVVRLKSGDPLIFGRAGEEMDALRNAAIPFTIVPGITAAFAAAAELRISLTDRRASSGVHLSSAHHAPHGANRAVDSNIPVLTSDTTHVIYMPGRSPQKMADKWLADGADPELPCTIISRAAQPDQHIQHTTLAELHQASPVAAPSLLLVGWALAAAINHSQASPAPLSTTDTFLDESPGRP